MAVRIRLKRMGSKKRPFYRIVAADTRSPRDGRFLEALGRLNPLTDPPEVTINEDALFKWLERGAVPTPNTESLLRRAGVMRKWQLLKQGVSREDLDAKLKELQATETPPEVPSEEVKTPRKAGAKTEDSETAVDSSGEGPGIASGESDSQ